MHIVGKTSGALGAGGVALLWACGGGRNEATEKYFLVAANTKIAYWQEAAEGLRAASRELGVKVEMVGPETYDPKAEKEALLAAVHGQIPAAGILVSAADPELMREAIDAAATAGIQIGDIRSESREGGTSGGGSRANPGRRHPRVGCGSGVDARGHRRGGHRRHSRHYDRFGLPQKQAFDLHRHQQLRGRADEW